ncbi:MAG: hypothetical protein H7287_12105 [Thermoleophilia bacterium]|nr:hypothetical protein [Thermoleophilia bacterium]
MLTSLTHRIHQLHRRDQREAGTSVVEYVGLGAVSAMLVSGIAAALDGHAGDRIATAIVKRIIEVISS